jgi:hypothetical protein
MSLVTLEGTKKAIYIQNKRVVFMELQLPWISDCVCMLALVTQHAKYMSYDTVICGLHGSTIFYHSMIFGKNLLNIKGVF